MPSIKTGPSTPGLQLLAIPAVVLLVAFLGYSSQWLFHTSPDLGPGPLTTTQTAIFNTLLLCLWWTYYNACRIDPGRYNIPSAPKPSSETEPPPPDGSTTSATRWCKKCRLPKAPRAHHCRHCARCVPKMDHHCPWTGNCVSLQTFPYFMRFLVFTNLSLWMLATFLFARFRALWASRDMPAYLGPTLPQLVHLTVLALVCSATMLALGILLGTTAKGWVLNMTMIEGWEVERHEAVVERYRGSNSSSGSSWWDSSGGEEDDDDGGERERDGHVGRLAIRHVEFPYDIGFFANMAQAMGTANVLAWFFPFSGGPTVSVTPGKGTGWEWEENGLNEGEGLWPPVDPEKARRARRGWPGAQRDEQQREWGSPEEEKAAFATRQAADLRRQWQSQRSGIIAELEEVDDYDMLGDGNDAHDYDYFEQGMDGEPGWTNHDGDRLRDYGVDEDAEDDDELADVQSQDEDVPLGELLRRRKVLSKDDKETEDSGRYT